VESGTVVIGLGSPLMGDDGLGLAALGALRERWRFEPEPLFLDGGTWGMNLLPAIESAERVLFIDAIRAGAEPGRLLVLEREALPRGLGIKLSPHQIDLQEVLALAELRGSLPAQSVALGIEPERVELGCELGPAVTAGLPALLDAIVQRLGQWGHEALPVADGARAIDPWTPARSAGLGS
jgi:hydrogenase maturation protease